MSNLPVERQRNGLRYWIHRDLGVSVGFERLNRIVRAIERHPQESGGLVWPPVELRFYRGRLYLVRPFRVPAERQSWGFEDDLVLGERMVLRRRRTTGRGLKAEVVERGVTVGFRRGGERCRLPGRRHRHTLKNILQDAGIPPWQRSRIPLIYLNGEIAAVAGVTCCDPYAAGPEDAGIEIEVLYG